MGNSQANSQLMLYGQAQHPLQGEVIAYMLKNQPAKFIMKAKMTVTKQQLELYETIGKEKHPRLLAYYGPENKDQIPTDQDIEKLRTKDKNNKSDSVKPQQFDILLYWQYLNWDLANEIKYLEQKNEMIKEQELWEILDCALQICQFLEKYNLYPSFRSKNIYFSAGREPKLHWCNLLPNNMHRAYERYLAYGQFLHTIYSPQQLLEINRRQRSKLDQQKCVMFELGLMILEAVTRTNLRYLYSYSHKTFSEVKKRQLMDKIKGKYEKQFVDVLTKLIQYFPKDRLGYKEFSARLDLHYQRNTQNIKLLTQVYSFNESNTNTFESKQDDLRSQARAELETNTKLEKQNSQYQLKSTRSNQSKQKFKFIKRRGCKNF